MTTPQHVDWFVDRFSVVHAAVGALFELSRIPAPLALGSHVAFEAAENRIKESWAKGIWPDIRPDAWQNHVGDFGSFTAGYYATRALRRSGPTGHIAITALVALAGGIWAWNLLASDRPKGGCWPAGGWRC